ncbi:MAG: glycosyltransferase [Pseudomonadota bacterium]
MLNKRKIFFYVQHLWGVGHVYRATRVAKALSNHGFEVHLIWGGTRIEGFDFSSITVHYLTPVRSNDVSFSKLVHGDGSEFTTVDQGKRAQNLLELFEKIQPDVLITEAFPFGRRQMRFELLPLLERAKASSSVSLIAASIRDIMQEGRKEKRVLESVNLVHDFFDLILVHGDPGLIRIEETLQGADQFADKIRYTGLVLPEPSDNPVESEFKCDVLVTVGGGAFGQKLTHTALEAMNYSKTFPKNWIVSAGTELAEEDFQSLLDRCPAGMRILRYIPNLANVMRHTKVSVSHAGYNTVGDILRAGCAAVLNPYADGKETEQLRRSMMMQDLGLAKVILPEALTPENLAIAVDEASVMTPDAIGFDTQGAEKSAKIIEDCLKNNP